MRHWMKFAAAAYLFVGLLQFGEEYSTRIRDFCARPYVSDYVRCDRALRAQGASTLVSAAIWPLTYARMGVYAVRDRLSGQRAGEGE